MNTSTLSSHSVKPAALTKDQTCASCLYLEIGNICFMYSGLDTDTPVAYTIIEHPELTARCRRAE